MKPVYQTKFGGSDTPEIEQGNCLAAALASVFELTLEDVPDFAGEISNGKWFLHLEQWLARRNLELMVFPTKGAGWPMGYYLAACKSTTLINPDDGHVVVMHHGTLVHNPHPHATSIGEIENLWVFVAIDPSKQAWRGD